MKTPQRIAFAKVGWAEHYAGDPVKGRAGWINRNDDAHERFNFRPGPDGRFYGYLPPIGPKYRTPQPAHPDDWLVVFVAPHEGNGSLVPVGWYEGATFEEDYDERPEYAAGVPLPVDVKGERYAYAIHADKGRLIPAELRARITVPGRPHFGSTPVLYASGHGPARPWRPAYRDLALRIVRASWASDDKLSGGGGFGNAETAKEVEVASVEATIRRLKNRGYGQIIDRQKDNCGYDLLARKPETDEELHVEVKGTSGTAPRFFMTPNEHAYMGDPRWRLAVVTDALGSAPKVSIYDARKVTQHFDLQPRVWEGRPKA